jgi:hypothetical protein
VPQVPATGCCEAVLSQARPIWIICLKLHNHVVMNIHTVQINRKEFFVRKKSEEYERIGSATAFLWLGYTFAKFEPSGSVLWILDTNKNICYNRNK